MVWWYDLYTTKSNYKAILYFVNHHFNNAMEEKNPIIFIK